MSEQATESRWKTLFLMELSKFAPCRLTCWLLAALVLLPKALALEIQAEHTFIIQSGTLEKPNDHGETTLLLRVVLRNNTHEAIRIPTASDHWCVSPGYKDGVATYRFSYVKPDTDSNGAPYIPPEAKYLSVELQPGESTLVIFQDTMFAEQKPTTVFVEYEVDDFVGKRFRYWSGKIECRSRGFN